MPLGPRWQDTALADLEGIRAYIAADAPGSATRVAAAIRDAVEPLAESPEMGRAGRVFGTRELILARLPYVVVYRVKEQTVEIHRVLHVARRWPHEDG